MTVSDQRGDQTGGNDSVVFPLTHPYVKGERDHLPKGRRNLCGGPCDLRAGILYRSCVVHSSMLRGWSPEKRPVQCGLCGQDIELVKNRSGSSSALCGCVGQRPPAPE